MIGLCFNALSTIFGTGMSLFAKISGSQGIGVFEIVLTRSLILVLFTGPDLIKYRINPFGDPRRRWLLVLRGVLGFCSVSSLYLAVALLPLADASVLSFLSPIFVAVLGPLILKEPSPAGVLLGIPVAMVGVVLVAQPTFLFGGDGNGGISGLGITVGIAQACFNALARICVRALSLGSSERMSSIIFGQGLISTLGAAIMCAATRNFKMPFKPVEWSPLLLGGLLGYFYQLALTAGLQRARAAPAVAMSYLSVIWGIIADIFVFHDLPDGLSLLGAGIICLSSLFVAFTQKRRASHESAADRWKQSSIRLQREAGRGGSEALLGRPAGGSEDGTEYASADERSLAASRMGSRAELDDEAGESNEGLKAVKDRLALAAAAEVQPPDTPAPAAFLSPGAGQLHGSADSLSPLGGASPVGSSPPENIGGLAGGRAGAP